MKTCQKSDVAFFSCQKLIQISGNYIKFPKERIKPYVAIEMLKTENQCKTPQIVGATDGTHIIKAPVSECRYDSYLRKQIYIYIYIYIYILYQYVSFCGI